MTAPDLALPTKADLRAFARHLAFVRPGDIALGFMLSSVLFASNFFVSGWCGILGIFFLGWRIGTWLLARTLAGALQRMEAEARRVNEVNERLVARARRGK